MQSAGKTYQQGAQPSIELRFHNRTRKAGFIFDGAMETREKKKVNLRSQNRRLCPEAQVQQKTLFI